MANTKISNAAAIAACDALVDLLDGGTVTIYDGSQPAGVDVDVTDQNVLSEHTLASPAFGDAADADPGAKATANAIADDVSANATGTATWFRATTSGGDAVIDGDVSESGGGGDMIISSTSIEAETTIEVTAWTVTLPES